MASIQLLARQMVEQMETREIDGEQQYCFKDGAPEWMRDALLECDTSSFKYLYEFGNDALHALVDSEPGDEEDAIDQLESDVYTRDLLTWLADNLAHQYHVDEWVSNVGWTNTFDALSGGQLEHKKAIGYALLEQLRERADETAGEAILLEAADVHAEFTVGDRVILNCTVKVDNLESDNFVTLHEDNTGIVVNFYDVDDDTYVLIRLADGNEWLVEEGDLNFVDKLSLDAPLPEGLIGDAE